MALIIGSVGFFFFPTDTQAGPLISRKDRPELNRIRGRWDPHAEINAHKGASVDVPPVLSLSTSATQFVSMFRILECSILVRSYTVYGPIMKCLKRYKFENGATGAVAPTGICGENGWRLERATVCPGGRHAPAARAPGDWGGFHAMAEVTIGGKMLDFATLKVRPTAPKLGR